MTITILDCDINDAASVRLIAELDAEMAGRYPASSIHTLDFAEFNAAGGVFLVACADGAMVGCGALRPLSAEAAEVKRMYVRPAHRRRGHSRAILEALENIARSRDHRRLLLETGNRQPEAVALYRAAGLVGIPSYGEYIGDPHSACFEKLLC